MFDNIHKDKKLVLVGKTPHGVLFMSFVFFLCMLLFHPSYRQPGYHTSTKLVRNVDNAILYKTIIKRNSNYLITVPRDMTAPNNRLLDTEYSPVDVSKLPACYAWVKMGGGGWPVLNVPVRIWWMNLNTWSRENPNYTNVQFNPTLCLFTSYDTLKSLFPAQEKTYNSRHHYHVAHWTPFLVARISIYPNIR